MCQFKLLTIKTIILGLLLASFAALQANAAADFDVRPTPVKTPPPEYPSALRHQGVSGIVALKVLIDETGSVSECTVAKSSNPGFEASALAAVKSWKFTPAQKAGKAVSTQLVIPIKFNLED